MRHLLLTSFSLVLYALLSSCAPNAKKIKEIIENDPSIVFSAIEKNPEQFIEVVNKAIREAQRKASEKAQQEEQAQRDNEFKNPLQPEIEPDRAILGPKDAKVTIVEYSDMECPYCARGHQTIKEVLNAYPNQVRVVLKHLPLDFHPKALPAAKYFEAIARQSAEKAYQFKAKVFENQSELRQKGEKFLEETAKSLGINMAKLKKDLDDPKIMDRIQKDMAEAQKFNIIGTPGFIINGVSLRGAYPFASFKEIIDRHLQNN
ncbi:MAG: thioredoxin domain-containing protein [Bdellovibrionaceae bacterium]|nr:thioredoxin domain-containing protein [Pseudobdellovibrionaceae bacterium]MDW8190421.1 thioredoxin domain-containing protein [Pseudobdellovibrionaceae bacterium]